MLLRRSARLAVVVACLAVSLAGCYFPLRFDAEAVISRAGFYDLRFDGQLAWVPLASAVREGKLTAAEEGAKAERIRTDLARDGATQRLRYLGRGIFDLSWRRSGDLLRPGMVSFVRRNERILTLKYVKRTGLITFEGQSLNAEQARRLAAAGLAMDGTLKVVTDARVVSHNAMEVRQTGPRERTYRWRLRGASGPAPKLVITVR